MRVVENLTARMRDGTLLRADLFRPPEGGRLPTLLLRTPCRPDRDDAYVRAAVARGYNLLVQDVRGRYASGGTFDPYRQEGPDGYDAVEWSAAQAWSDGRIGMVGLSYPGAVQWLAAVETPPHLACIFPAMSFSSGRQFFYFGGAFDLSWLPWIAVNIAPDLRRRLGRPGPATVPEARDAWRREAADAWRHLPPIALPLFQGLAPFYYEWLDHPDDGSYWDFADVESRHNRVRVPVFNFSGWHDEGYGPVGATRNFAGLRARGGSDAARDPRLVIGPWTHGAPTPATTRAGTRDFGAGAGLDYHALVMDWCDLHLRGIDRGLGSAPRVRLFVMGANAWRESGTWPPAGIEPRDLYLRAGGGLAWTPPGQHDAPAAFTADPRTPVEDPHAGAGLGAHDQRAVEARPDVLVFTSDPLPADLEIVGAIEFRLWVASSAPDCDIVARLLDVEPDGPAWNLMSPTLEVLRLRYRDGEEAPVPLVPGRPYEVTLGLGLTANRFLRGHRIRVQVMSSFFPHVDRNPQTGAPVATDTRLAPARQTLFVDAARPSRVRLPVVRTPG